MKLLDLFCCAGGAAMGYHRAGFTEIVGVDNRPQPRYPFQFVQADALEYLARLIKSGEVEEFDLIHASPPCQAYTGMRNITLSRFGSVPEHPDLIDPVRRLLQESGRPYVIENVQCSPVDTHIIICGAAVGLPGLSRHRHFESNVLLWGPPKCARRQNKLTIGVYGSRPDGRRVSQKVGKFGRVANSIDEAREIMGIDWMEWDEIREAIPPAYTEWIGRQMICQLEEARP